MELTFELILLWLAVFFDAFLSFYSKNLVDKKMKKIEEAEKRISELYFKVND